MRCHSTDKDEETNSVPSGLRVWSSANLQMPSILKTFNNSFGKDLCNCVLQACPMATTKCERSGDKQELPNFCSADAVAHKRKILDCEREDFEERFRKVQRKKHLQRITARANLIVDDDDSDSDFDEENEMYEKMDWIERENYIMNSNALERNEDYDSSFENIKTNVPLICVPRLKWREERRRLLKISMAKIRGVEDPEAYLRRSVLINNTVKRLQKDVSVNYRCHTVASSSLFQGGSAFQNENASSWEIENANSSFICKQMHSETSIGFECATSILNNDTVVHFNDPEVLSDISYNSLNLHLSFASSFSSGKELDGFQHEVLHGGQSPFFSKVSVEEQRLSDVSIPSRTLKQLSPVHLFSSQPCGLQYRNPAHGEDSNREYHESTSSSSILDSVVYHSLIASLET